MKKVITFSLWGNKKIYNYGAIQNCILAQTIYPDFECWFYIHKESVPIETINNLYKMSNSKIIFKEGNLDEVKPRMWRFEAIDEPDVEILMSRDTDSRFLIREKLAVDEWLKSDKLFHIMRDHPYHTATILAGMFGTKKIPYIKNWKTLLDNFKQTNNINYDQIFLDNYIYPLVCNDALIHASFFKIENHAINFPTTYDEECNFVGQYVYEDDTTNLGHRMMIKNQI